MAFCAIVLAALLLGHPSASGGAPRQDGIERLIARLEQASAAGNRDALVALAAQNAPGLDEFVGLAVPAPDRFIIKERDRSTINTTRQRLLLELFVVRGTEGRVATWRVDVDRDEQGGADAWRIAELERYTVVSGLYKLSLDATRQFDVRDLVMRAPDLTLELPAGQAFLSETPEGVTGVVLIGRGRMRFAPPDAAEQTQIRILSGDSALDAEFDAAFVRLRPAEFTSRFAEQSLRPRAVSQGDFRRAHAVFEDYVGRTLQIDLADLTRERWSLTPQGGDLIAEVRTKKFGTLTYSRATKDAEDVSVFDRKKRRNISIYASKEKLESRGRFYSEDDLVDYDAEAFELDVAYQPDRMWLDGTARLRLKVRSPALNTLSLKLADSLVVRGVYSPQFGRLLHLRVVGQNSVIVNLPASMLKGSVLHLIVVYGGRLESQMVEREAIGVSADQDIQQEPLVIPLEPRFIYSNRSYWYPQPTVTDYATARLRISVPSDYEVVASGNPSGPAAPVAGPVEPGQRPRKVFVFESERPLRYLAFVTSRFQSVSRAMLNVPTTTEAREDGETERSEDDVAFYVHANPRQMGRARGLTDRSSAIFRFYSTLIGEAPYPSFTLAITESDLPGGHSPPYFVVLNQPLPTSPFTWRNDPVNFDGYPTFFIAHEVAHQWWGQGVGWKNYHEQWLSEGFAQYFAAMYAAQERGDDLFTDVLRQMRRWAIDRSEEGPIYLGYRLGHIKSDGRVFRALVYNKGAMVLHMLRRMLGEEAFFDGLRRFYTEWKFKKAGTDDFRRAMESVARQDLAAFFEAWVYGSAIPTIKLSHERKTDGQLLVRLEHRGDVMPTPVTVTVSYTDGSKEDVMVMVAERVVERTLPLKGTVRSVDVNRDSASLAEFEK